MLTWLPRFPRLNSTRLGLLLTLIMLVFFWLDDAHETGKTFMVAPLRRLELLASDLRFRVRGPLTPGPEVVIAAIDEQSIEALGRWPWPYTVQAELVRRLTSYGAAAIGYDVVFSESDTSAGLDNLQAIEALLATRDYYADADLKRRMAEVLARANHDQIFATALQESERTILGYFFHWQCRDVEHLPDADLERYLHNLTLSKNARYVPRVAPGASLGELQLASACAVKSNLPVLSQAVWGNGFFNSRPDTEDGVIRHYPLIAQYRGRVQVPAKMAGTRRALGRKPICSRRSAFASSNAICKAVTAMPTRECSSMPTGKSRYGLQQGANVWTFPLIKGVGWCSTTLALPSLPRARRPRTAVATAFPVTRLPTLCRGMPPPPRLSIFAIKWSLSGPRP